MNAKHTEQKGNLKTAVLVVVLILLVYLLASFFADQRFEALESDTRLLISEQNTILATIAETTARNGADLVTESIVKDCSLNERSSFDTLLGNLNNGLSQSQLVELERLFGRCGSFYSERKSVMVSRLVRETEIYTTYVDQLSAILDEDVSEDYKLSSWQQLSVQEQRISELFAELVVKQDRIINTLLSGSSPQSEEIQTILQEVNEVQQTLIVSNTQVATLRSELVSF